MLQKFYFTYNSSHNWIDKTKWLSLYSLYIQLITLCLICASVFLCWINLIETDCLATINSAKRWLANSDLLRMKKTEAKMWHAVQSCFNQLKRWFLMLYHNDLPELNLFSIFYQAELNLSPLNIYPWFEY